MEEFTRPAVDCFVEAMYTGEADKLEKDIFEDVNKMAHVFDVSWLTKRCLKFYKSDIMNFEDDSYEDILFACEIASRAHYHLNQTKLVNCFVKTIASRGVDKGIFVTRYLAGFASVPKRKIDMALMIARDSLDIIGNCLMAYLSFVLECKRVDENSLYLLQKLNTQNFRNTFPVKFKQLTNFVVSLSLQSDCAEETEIIENLMKDNVQGYESINDLKEKQESAVKTLESKDTYNSGADYCNIDLNAETENLTSATNTDDPQLGSCFMFYYHFCWFNFNFLRFKISALIILPSFPVSITECILQVG